MRDSDRMKSLSNYCNGGVHTRIPFLTSFKFLLAVGLLLVGLQSSRAARADTLQSPRGADLFSQATPMVLLPPGKKLRLVWDYPVQRETPDLVFKVYHSTRLGPSFHDWALL